MKHKIVLKIVSLVLIVTFLPFIVWAQNTRQITAEGIAVLMEDKAIARDRAIDDALRKAVEQALGTMVENETIVNNFQLISDNIYSRSRGYVQSYRVVREQAGENVYNVIVEAAVSIENMESDLAALSLLLKRVHNPRLLVIIEMVNGNWHTNSSRNNPAVLTIIDEFKKKGFEIIDNSASTDPADLKNNQAIAKWGLEQGAELVAIGQVSINKSASPYLGSMKSYKAILNLSLIKTGNAQVLAVGSDQDVAVNIDDLNGNQMAMEKVAAKLAPQIITQVVERLNKEIGEGASLHLVISGVNDQQLMAFKTVLAQEVRGILPGGIHQRYFGNSTANFDVELKGTAQSLADELTGKKFKNFRLSLTQFSPGKLEFKFIPNE